METYLIKHECLNCGHIGYPAYFNYDTHCEKCFSRTLVEIDNTQEKPQNEFILCSICGKMIKSGNICIDCASK